MSREDLDLYDILFKEFYQADERTVNALAGPSGAGKTSVVVPHMESYARTRGFDVTVLDLDAFFRTSRAERDTWIKEPMERGDVDEYIRRIESAGRWNIEQAVEALTMLSRGQDYQLVNAYKRPGGVMERTEPIRAPRGEGMILFDTVLLSPFLDLRECLFHGMAYLYAKPPQRVVRTTARSPEKDDAADVAFSIMDQQRRDHKELQTLLPYLISSGIPVIDNRAAQPSLMRMENGDYPILRAAVDKPFRALYFSDDAVRRLAQRR